VFKDTVSKNLGFRYGKIVESNYGISNAPCKPHTLLTCCWRSKCDYSCKEHNVNCIHF